MCVSHGYSLLTVVGQTRLAVYVAARLCAVGDDPPRLIGAVRYLGGKGCIDGWGVDSGKPTHNIKIRIIGWVSG